MVERDDIERLSKAREQAYLTLMEKQQVHKAAVTRFLHASGEYDRLVEESATHRDRLGKSSKGMLRGGYRIDYNRRIRERFRSSKRGLRQAEQQLRAAQKHYELARQDYDAACAHWMGVPAPFLTCTRVVPKYEDDQLVLHAYFGGRTRVGDPKCGHYIMTQEGVYLYRREPGTSRGPHNVVAPTSPSVRVAQ